MQSIKRYWKIYLAGFVLIMALLFMAQLRLQVPAFAQERYADLQNFSKVLNLIQQYYVEGVDTKKLIYGAIKGMLRELSQRSA